MVCGSFCGEKSSNVHGAISRFSINTDSVCTSTYIHGYTLLSSKKFLFKSSLEKFVTLHCGCREVLLVLVALTAVFPLYLFLWTFCPLKYPQHSWTPRSPLNLSIMRLQKQLPSSESKNLSVQSCQRKCLKFLAADTPYLALSSRQILDRLMPLLWWLRGPQLTTSRLHVFF